METLEVDNTLSAFEIQKKLIDKEVNMSTSTIRIALKVIRYKYQKPNIAAMILTSNLTITRKMLWEKYLGEDRFKYIITEEVVFKEGKMRSRK